MNEPHDPRALITLENVRVHELCPDASIAHFTVIHNGEIVKVRNRLTGNFELLKEHQDKALDLTISPYQWSTKNHSGVVYYFHHFRIHKES